MTIITRPLALGGAVHANTLPPEAIFVIGDVHGQWRALDMLLATMARTKTGSKTRLLLTLGDTIHKGPQSRRVLTAMLNGDVADKMDADTHVPLMGNHEILFARALVALEQGNDGTPWLNAWARSGGKELLESWKKDQPGKTKERLTRWRDGFKAPLAKIASWGSAWEHEGMTGVHAGFAPGADWRAMGAMDAYALHNSRLTKNPHHWATVRAPFLDWTQGFGGRLVAHGHTPPRGLFRRTPRQASDLIHAFDASAHKGRICLDGGAGFGIGVAGAIIEDGTVRFLFAPC